MDISSVILIIACGIKVINRGKPKDNHTCKISLYIYVQLDDYNTYLTSLNDIFMLYKVEITYTKIFERRGGTGPPGSAPAPYTCTLYVAISIAACMVRSVR